MKRKASKSMSDATTTTDFNDSISVRRVLSSLKRDQRHRLLAALALIFVLFSALLILIWRLSANEDGFQTTLFSQSIFTYAPTAFMLLVVAAWRQVDYACKSAAPWNSLRNGPVTAAKSVFLDYLSTFQVLGLYHSIKNRHFPVSLGIIGFMLLKLATIASTGLLVLAPHTMQSPQTITIGSAFDGGLYNRSNFTVLQDQSLVYTSYGLMAAGLAPPFGVTADAAYSTFEWPSDYPSNATLSMSLDAMFPSLSCRSANISIDSAQLSMTDDSVNPKREIRLSAPGCETNPGSIYALNPVKYMCPTRQLSGTIHTTMCQDERQPGINSTWQLITLTDIHYQQILNGSEKPGPFGQINALSSSTTIANVTSILCRLSYTVDKVQVSAVIDELPAKLTMSARPDQSEGKLENFIDNDLNQLARSAWLASSDVFGTSTDNTFSIEYPDTMLKLMASQGNGSYTSLFEEDTLIRAATIAFKYVAVQSMSKYLRKSSATESPAVVTVITDSVHVIESSVWLMFAAFVAAMLITIYLSACAYKEDQTISFRTMYDVADMTRKSTSLWSLLEESQILNADALKKHLVSFQFCTTVDAVENFPAVVAIPVKEALVINRPVQAESTPEEWWKQLTTSYWFLGSTFLYAVLVIVVLEVLQRLSASRNGIVVVSGSDLRKTTLTHYFPVLVVILLSTMFNCLDFNVLLLHPYHKLAKTNSAKLLFQRPPISLPPVISYFRAIRCGDWAMFGSSTAAFVGALLTIVVSGLYSIETVSSPQSSRIMAFDTFNLSWPNSASDDGGAAILLSLTENLNLSYPRGSYEELALPLLSVPINSSDQHDNTDLSVQLPEIGYRANLECEAADPDDFDLTITRLPIQQSAFINASYPLPPSCLRGSPSGNSSSLTFSYTFNFALNATEAYIAKMLDLHVGPYDAVFGGSQGETNPSNNPDNPPGCPSLAFIYGYLRPSDLAQAQTNLASPSVAVQVCYQTISHLSVNTTLIGPELTISPITPPLINEPSAQKLPVPRTNSTQASSQTDEMAFQFRIQSHMDNALSFFNDPSNPFITGSTATPTVDNFFQGVFFGRTPLPINTLQLTNPSSQALLLSSINAFYRRYMAQVISVKMRVNVTGLSQAELQDHEGELAFEGTIINGLLRERIVQHKGPKLILQGMISIMLIGGMIAISTTKISKILPASANPCTVWGQMMLWGGSRFAADMNVVLEKRSEVLVAGKVVEVPEANNKCQMIGMQEVGTRRFRLGWWESGTRDGVVRRRYGIDIVPEG